MISEPVTINLDNINDNITASNKSGLYLIINFLTLLDILFFIIPIVLPPAIALSYSKLYNIKIEDSLNIKSYFIFNLQFNVILSFMEDCYYAYPFKA